jgi:kinesin family protein C1
MNGLKTATVDDESAPKKTRFNIFKSPTIQRIIEHSKVPAANPPKEREKRTSNLPRFPAATEKKRSMSTSGRKSSIATGASAVICDSTAAATGASIPVPATPTSASNVARSPAQPRASMIATPGSGGTKKQMHHVVSSGIRTNLRSHRYSIGTKLRKIFEVSASGVDEDKINELLSNKTKGVAKRWDYKDKAQKQEALIVDLRAALKSLMEDRNQMKEKCLSAEGNLSESFREVEHQRQELLQEVDALRANESKVRKEYAQTASALSTSTSSLQRAQSDNEKLKKRVEELEEALVGAHEKYNLEHSARRAIEHELAGAKGELSMTKQFLQDSSSLYSSQIEQRMEQYVSGYKDQVASLTSQLENQRAALERRIEEKGEADRSYMEVRESLLTSQADLREAQNLVQRLQSDLGKSEAEVVRLRDLLDKKDEKLTSHVDSYHALQISVAEEKNSLSNELKTLKDRLFQVEQDKVQLTADIAILTNQSNSAMKELEQLRAVHSQTSEVLAAREAELDQARYATIELNVAMKEKERREQKMEEMQRELVATSAQLKATETETSRIVRDLQDKAHAEQASLRQHIEEAERSAQNAAEEARRYADIATTFESQVKELRHALEDAEKNSESAVELGRVSAEAEILRRRVSELIHEKKNHDSMSAERIHDLEAKLQAGEVMRRKMHNIIQELRGNVRVFARVRPYLPNDGVDTDNPPEPTIHVRDNSSLRIIRASNGSTRPEDHSFSFDKAFGPSTSQEAIFEEVSEFVQSALDGYNVCLFSCKFCFFVYMNFLEFLFLSAILDGQTGSGKTHTMQGSGDGAMRGIIPRAMQQVALYKKELEHKGWEYHMEASFIEIYNETIKDLLREDEKDDKHDIKKDAAGNIYVSDVTMIPVDLENNEQMDGIMCLAAKHRSVGQTAMNERSSRSHSVFTLHLRAVNVSQNISLKGTLNLVDLAGSERLDRSGATGDRLKEAVAINKSLSALTDVFVAISNKQAHIPYRNSKLTHLLQPALSGDGKTLMVHFKYMRVEISFSANIVFFVACKFEPYERFFF